MELVPYDESREYGKKVIANYVIYNHLFLDNNLTLHSLLKK
jgi:soluble lytic murein transglycosylase